MTTQPEALKLAGNLEALHGHRLSTKAAAELRRLHESNQELLAALKEAIDVCIWPSAALSSAYEQALAAIAKAERTTP